MYMYVLFFKAQTSKHVLSGMDGCESQLLKLHVGTKTS